MILTGMFCLFLLYFHCMNFVNVTILPHSYSLMMGGENILAGVLCQSQRKI